MTPRERLAAKYVVDENGCWLWQGALNWGGYGQFWLNGRRMNVHRASYLLHVGPIPDGLDLDHLCRVRHCINPAHLEPVTRSENLLRGNVGGYLRDVETCPQGHAYDESNTYHDSRGWRGCRKCRRDAANRYHKQRRAS